MLEEVVVIFYVEERLYSFWSVDGSVGKILCGIRKKLWTTDICTSKSIAISKGSKMVYKGKFQPY